MAGHAFVSRIANHKRVVRVNQVLDYSPVRVVIALAVTDTDSDQRSQYFRVYVRTVGSISPAGRRTDLIQTNPIQPYYI